MPGAKPRNANRRSEPRVLCSVMGRDRGSTRKPLLLLSLGQLPRLRVMAPPQPHLFSQPHLAADPRGTSSHLQSSFSQKRPYSQVLGLRMGTQAFLGGRGHHSSHCSREHSRSCLCFHGCKWEGVTGPCPTWLRGQVPHLSSGKPQGKDLAGEGRPPQGSVLAYGVGREMGFFSVGWSSFISTIS